MFFDNIKDNQLYLDQLNEIKMSEAFELEDEIYFQQKNKRIALIKEYKDSLIQHLEYAKSINIAIPLHTIVVITSAENLYINNLIDYYTTVFKKYDNTDFVYHLMNLHIKKIQDLINNQQEHNNEV